MKPMEVVRTLMGEKGVSTGTMANRLKIQKSAMSQRFKQNNMSVKVLDGMLRMLDYKIVVMPIDGKLPNGAYEIE